MKTVDARGLACPQPVMLTRDALAAEPEGAVLLVDEICAVENIHRYAAHMGYAVQKEEDASGYRLTLTKR